MPNLSSVKSVSCALIFGPKLLHAPLGMPQAHMQQAEALPICPRFIAHTTYILWKSPDSSPVGLVLSRWAGCRCWMFDGSWLGMWMVVAGEDGS